MPQKLQMFRGNIDDLKSLVEQAGFQGEWSEHRNNHHKFLCQNGAVLNWWDTKKKTINFQGPDFAKSELEEAFVRNLAAQPAISAVDNPTMITSRATPEVVEAPPHEVTTPGRAKPKIFIVHGHDDTAREQLELVLHRLGLDPFVLQHTGGGGLTFIEALEKQIGKKPTAQFGVVLLTPDDIGYARRDGPKKAEPRPRQNVVMEMGMLMASLGRERVAVLVKGDLETPSDAHGLIYFSFNSHVREVAPKLADCICNAGFDIPRENITKATQ